MISPSSAQLEKGERLKKEGKNYQFYGVLLIIIGFILVYYYVIYLDFNSYNYSGDEWDFFLTGPLISILTGVIFIFHGTYKAIVGKRLLRDIFIPSDFSGMNGHEFNDYIVKIYIAMDYICRNLPGSGDRGADFLAEKDGVRYVVQTKRWKNKVGSPTIQKLVGSKAWYKADKAICVTNSEYTKPARQWEARGVELIDGRRLDEMIIALHNR